ncbi:ribonuclease III domain-containing protein [Microdochium trichocladiopsis]|uniref:Ribonuclease III domain-containing protein n=1 Tax=Microdochium trichocladiopsis TaxID=1682393 RepID=A0A9P9BKD5_9PEZI|nr:ribonuclease III domain-containing protein [Microdochium trichocladiopsis]KAH7021086.1 ribonuclease III domain-containing protein [Microdochium trichocladiopsis]
MPKRSHAELDGSAASMSEALARVDDILSTASRLKRELEQLRDLKQNGSIAPAEASTTLQEHANKILDSATRLSQQVTKDSLSAEADSRKSQRLDTVDAQNLVPKELPIPSPSLLTAWTLQDVPEDGNLPPLPSVADSLLEKAALTHTGMSAKSTDLSYERLEWIGDAYLYLMSSAFIFHTFPVLSVGRSAQLREKLVKNDTLRGYTLNYRLNQRANFPAEFDLHGRSGGTAASNKVKNKVLGDIFESYFAAIILGNPNGLELATAFIKKVWAVTLSPEIRKECKAQEQHRSQTGPETASTPRQEQNHKVELAKTIGGPNIYIDYKQIGEKKSKESGTPLYTMGVFLTGWGETGLQIGFGTALSKKDAGQKAAACALENKKLIKRLVAVRTDFLKAVAAQKEQQKQ